MRTANVQGVVRIKVRTDGHRVVDANAEGGGIVPLSHAALENVRTWKFADHEPTTLTVIYRYIIDDKLSASNENPTIVFRLPAEVEIRTSRWPGTHDMPTNVK